MRRRHFWQVMGSLVGSGCHRDLAEHSGSRQDVVDSARAACTVCPYVNTRCGLSGTSGSVTRVPVLELASVDVVVRRRTREKRSSAKQLKRAVRVTELVLPDLAEHP